MKTNTSTPLLLDLGCGRDKYQDDHFRVIGIDAWEKSHADLRASCLHLPLRSQCAGHIYARHFFEHSAYEDPLLIKAMDRLINGLQSLERFFTLIGGAYELRCVLKKDSQMLDSQHIDGAKILA